MNKTFKTPATLSEKAQNLEVMDINAGAGWHIAGLWTFILSLPIPFILHRFVGVNPAQISLIVLLSIAGLLVVQFEAFRRSNGILRPIALASMLFYGMFLFNMLPK